MVPQIEATLGVKSSLPPRSPFLRSSPNDKRHMESDGSKSKRSPAQRPKSAISRSGKLPLPVGAERCGMARGGASPQRGRPRPKSAVSRDGSVTLMRRGAWESQREMLEGRRDANKAVKKKKKRPKGAGKRREITTREASQHTPPHGRASSPTMTAFDGEVEAFGGEIRFITDMLGGSDSDEGSEQSDARVPSEASWSGLEEGSGNERDPDVASQPYSSHQGWRFWSDPPACY